MTTHAPGDVVRGYRIVRTLGRGGLGTTFAAMREENGELVALKRLAVADADAWKRIELFEREARVLSRLEHPAIPRYVDHFTVEGPDGPTLYIAQELVAGRSLGEIVRANGVPLDEPEVRRIADMLLAVLDYLGQQVPPVIHRDIKPDNVILRPDGTVALVDFGAATAAVARAEGGSTTVGTYGYMAPEQLHGVATPATDIYGLACTLLFLLTARPPTDLPRKKLRIDFQAHARLTPPFARWLQDALEPAPEDRFLSASSARMSLRGSTAGRDPPTALGAPRRPWTRALLAALALLATATGFLLWARTRSRASRPAACPEFDTLDPKFADLSVEELELRFRESWILPPSTADRQLAAIRAAADVYTPERRACMTRISLVSSIASQEQMRRTMPSLWGLGHTTEELRTLYLSVPLRTEHTTDQRLDVLAQVDENFIPSLAADSEADVEHWRRQYYGLLIVCEAGDAPLARLGTSRPSEHDCLHLTPRPAARNPDP
jgi:serine/threonine protein kinase